jgi:cell division protein ZapA (FtsZ GTPase activity inhibitor)
MGSAAAMTAAQIRCNGAPLHVYVLVSMIGLNVMDNLLRLRAGFAKECALL